MLTGRAVVFDTTHNRTRYTYDKCAKREEVATEQHKIPGQTKPLRGTCNVRVGGYETKRRNRSGYRQVVATDDAKLDYATEMSKAAAEVKFLAKIRKSRDDSQLARTGTMDLCGGVAPRTKACGVIMERGGAMGRDKGRRGEVAGAAGEKRRLGTLPGRRACENLAPKRLTTKRKSAAV